MMKQHKIIISSLSAFIMLTGCGGGSSSDSTTTDSSDSSATEVSDTSTIVDITDKILINRSASCAEYAESYSASVDDIQNGSSFSGSLVITVGVDSCFFTSNAIPNHDFNDYPASFAHDVSEQDLSYSIPKTPVIAASTTALSLGTDNAIFLNGVKLDLLAAGCYGVGNGSIGCFTMGTPFRYDPMSPLTSFGTDDHNAHTQPDGTYHYHGNPNALFSDTATVSPVVGFAADGFPIYGSYFDDDGTVREATSSYTLKTGSRVAVNGIDPGGTYDGTFVDDYEYSDGSGDLDECNGMTINGQYGYYMTDNYPWVLGCFSGTPDSSFDKTRP